MMKCDIADANKNIRGDRHQLVDRYDNLRRYDLVRQFQTVGRQAKQFTICKSRIVTITDEIVNQGESDLSNIHDYTERSNQTQGGGESEI